MKNIFKYLGLAVMSMAMLSLTACNNDDKKEDNQTPSTGSTVYKLHYGTPDGAVVANGDTVDYTPDRWEYEATPAESHATLFIENCTSAPVMTTQTYEFVEGQTGQLLEICAGGSCPWNGQPYEVQPGLDTDQQYPIVVSVGLDPTYTGVSIVKLKVGRADNLADAVTVYVRVHLN